jgi:uncharacterized membrane protein YoaK (UPF0700 family)
MRSLAGIAAGLVAWTAVATLGNLLVRVALPGYADVEAAMNFTLVMLVARLLVGIVSSIVAGSVAARVATARRRDVLILSILLIALFVPVHYSLWTRFPIWYHAAFLLSLVVAPALGARFSPGPSRIRRESRA